MISKTIRYVEKIHAKGPDAYTIDEDGDAVDYKVGREMRDYPDDFVLIRDDGYSVATCEMFADGAYAIDKGRWIGFLITNDDNVYGMIRWDDRMELLDAAN